MIKIDNTVPVPVGANLIRLALNKMEVGDSFFLDNLTISLRTTLHIQMKKKTDAKFMSRAENNGIRVWRLA